MSKNGPTATEVLPFTPGKPIEGLFLDIAVRPGLSTAQARAHGRHLITGGIEVLEGFARQGMPVKKLYATSRTTDGIELCTKLGFKAIIFESEQLKPNPFQPGDTMGYRHSFPFTSAA